MNIKIISCNIRASTMPDQENAWEYRRELCGRTIRNQNPDIVCLQETTWTQFHDLLAMPAYQRFDTFWMEHHPEAGQPLNAIFYDKKRFDLYDCGGYWLSKTPRIPGSSSWNSECIRIANYVVLGNNSAKVRIVNTHLDHASQEARLRQSTLIIEESANWDNIPQVLTGDMNCDISNEVIQRICAAGWRDSFFEATGIQMPGFTFHNFSGEKWQGDMGGCGNDKMDWIFLRGKLRATGASIIKDHEKSLYPSDHYFVTADLKLC